MENSKIPLKPSLANNNYLDTTFHCTIILTQTDILGEKSYWLGEWWPVELYCLPQSHSISSEVGLVFSTKDSDLGLTIIERKKGLDTPDQRVVQVLYILNPVNTQNSRNKSL